MDPMNLLSMLPASSDITLVQVDAEVDQTDDSYILRLDLPGVELEDINLTVVGDAINIAWTRARRNWKDSFRGVLHCPRLGDPSSITASMKSGVLTLAVAKVRPAEGRKVEVLAG